MAMTPEQRRALEAAEAAEAAENAAAAKRNAAYAASRKGVQATNVRMGNATVGQMIGSRDSQ